MNKQKLTFEERVDDIIERGLISWINDDIAFVTSQADSNKGYEVIPLYNLCECKQKELFPNQDCKHLAACKRVKLQKIKAAVSAAVVRSLEGIGAKVFTP